MKQVITEMVARKAALPARGQRTIWDKSLSNFGLRLSQGGARSWVVQVGANRRLITLGRYPLVSLAEARREAKRVLAEATLGKQRPARITFPDAKAQFLEYCEEKNRARTVADYRRLLTRHFNFGPSQLSEIGPQEIERRLRKLSGVPSERSHAYAAGKIFFNWALKRGLVEHNPFERIPAPPSGRPRARVLSDSEVREVYRAVEEEPYPYGPIVLLLLLTGQRRGEIAGLRWDWIDRQQRLITFPPSATKNDREHMLPYGDSVASLLGEIPELGDYLFPAARSHVRGRPTTVFNGWPKAKARFDARLNGVAHYTHHDLRRTFSTKLASLGVAPHIIEALLNHAGGTVSGVAAIYNRHLYLDEQQAALRLWENQLTMAS